MLRDLARQSSSTSVATAERQIVFAPYLFRYARRTAKISHFLEIQEDITESASARRELDRHRHHLQELVAERTADLEADRRHGFRTQG